MQEQLIIISKKSLKHTEITRQQLWARLTHVNCDLQLWMSALSVLGCDLTLVCSFNPVMSLYWYALICTGELCYIFLFPCMIFLGSWDWSTPKSDWLYSLQSKTEKLYTVSKNKNRSWLWLRSVAQIRTSYCPIRFKLKLIIQTPYWQIQT